MPDVAGDAPHRRPVLVPVILCGGLGSRLWPVSRTLHPKPFIRMPDGESLLQKAFLRGCRVAEGAGALVVTGRDLYFKVAQEIADVNAAPLPVEFLLEPTGRGTAAAVAVAALEVQALHGADAQLLVLPADHLVRQSQAFAAAVSQARDMARAQQIVVFGVRPQRAETAYGYIEADGHAVRQFVEKPDLETARTYVASGRFFWNAGMLCATAGALLGELERHAPEVLAAVRRSRDEALRMTGSHQGYLEFPAASFARVPEISFDHAVLEKSRAIAMQPCDMDWTDVGSWSALGDLLPHDEHGNRVAGDVALRDAANCQIHAGHRLVTALGVNDLLIVETPDALLVAHRAREQEVRSLFAQLQDRGHPAHRLHRTVHRPWGIYTVLAEGARFKVKQLVVRAGASLSLQVHGHRSEHWVVVQGIARVRNGEQMFDLQADASTYVPAGSVHRLSNPGAQDLVMIEVQSGDYVGEDDITRFDSDPD